MNTREQLTKAGKMSSPPHSYYAHIMQSFAKGRESVKVFHSDVYYVRAALEARTGLLMPLPQIEKAMKAEGWG
jgi:hypothetical protein